MHGEGGSGRPPFGRSGAPYRRTLCPLRTLPYCLTVMKSIVEILKTTAVGGLVFLVPLVVAGMVLFKALDMMKRLAAPLDRWLGSDSELGVLALDLVLLAMVFLACLVAGLVAKSQRGRKVGTRVESALLSAVPGYAFVKGFTDSMSSSDDASESFTPVVARFDDNAMIAFEVERTESGKVVVYLPGAPNPWSGSLVYMTADRVEPLDVSMTVAVKSIRQLGRGSVAFGS